MINWTNVSFKEKFDNAVNNKAPTTSQYKL